MKYFRLIHGGLNTSETGTQFQSVSGQIGDIQKDFIPFEGKINFDFALPEPHLEKKAKPTTYLNVTMIPSWFLVLKKEFIQFLNSFDIGDYQTWDINVHHNGQIIKDYRLFTLSNAKQREYINFLKSRFYVGEISNPNYKGKSLAITNYQDYLSEREKLIKQNLIIKYEKLVLNLNQISIDMFRIINTPCSGYYVSQILKTEIEKSSFTGFAFKEIQEAENNVEIIY